MALTLDVGGSSTSAANLSSGGNAGIQFAPRGLDSKMIALVAAAVLVAFVIWSKTKGKR